MVGEKDGIGHEYMQALGKIKMKIKTVLETDSRVLAFLGVVVEDEHECKHCHEDDSAQFFVLL